MRKHPTTQLFHSDTSCGVLIAGIAVVLAIVLPKNWYLAWYLPLYLLGITHGVALRNLRLCVIGLFASIVLVNIFGELYHMVYGGWELLNRLPQSQVYLDLIFHGAMYLWGGLLGGAVTLYRERLFLVGIFSSFASVILLCVLAAAFYWISPQDYENLKSWHKLTLLAAVPVVGIGMWKPIEVIRSKINPRKRPQESA